MEQHVSSIRAEVLRQLVGVSGGWFIRFLTVALLFWFVFYVYETLVDGTLSERLSYLKKALFSKEDTFKVKNIAVKPFAYFVAFLMALTSGYTLGYNISSNYISGEITLITTVARITNFYALTVTVVEMILLACSSLILLATASSIRKNGREVYQTSTLSKLNLGLLKFIRLVGILVVLVLGVASMVFCYLVIK